VLGGGLEEEWGEEPELFYILGPVPTLAWVAQVSEGRAPLLGGGLEEEWGEEPGLFYILGLVPTLTWVAQVSEGPVPVPLNFLFFAY
jgi:hypothetical protein